MLAGLLRYLWINFREIFGSGWFSNNISTFSGVTWQPTLHQSIMSLPYQSRLLSRVMSVRPVLRPVTNIFFSLHKKNTERISMKFVGGDYYHDQIKWLRFWRNWNRNTQQDKIKIRIDVNRFWRDVKHVLTPGEWIHKFTAQTMADAIEDNFM